MADLSISKNMTSSAFQPFAEYATIKKPQKSTTFYSTKHDNSNISPAPAPVELIHSRDTVQALPVHPNGAFIPIKQMTSTMHCSTPSGSSTSTITSPNNRNSLQINNQNNTTPLRIPQPPYSRHSSSPSSSSSTPTPNSSSMTRFPPQNNSTRSSITSIKPQIIGAGSGNAAAAVAAALHVARPDMSSKTFNELVEIARQQQQQIEANKIELDERKKLIESTKMQNGNNVSTMAEKLRVLRAEIAKDERDLSQLSEAQRKAKQISLQNEIKRAELMTLQETYAQDEQQLRHAVDKVDSLKKQLELLYRRRATAASAAIAQQRQINAFSSVPVIPPKHTNSSSSSLSSSQRPQAQVGPFQVQKPLNSSSESEKLQFDQLDHPPVSGTGKYLQQSPQNPIRLPQRGPAIKRPDKPPPPPKRNPNTVSIFAGKETMKLLNNGIEKPIPPPYSSINSHNYYQNLDNPVLRHSRTDQLSIRNDSMKAIKRRSWIQQNDSSDTDIYRILLEEQKKGRTHISFDDLHSEKLPTATKEIEKPEIRNGNVQFRNPTSAVNTVQNRPKPVFDNVQKPSLSTFEKPAQQITNVSVSVSSQNEITTPEKYQHSSINTDPSTEEFALKLIENKSAQKSSQKEEPKVVLEAVTVADKLPTRNVITKPKQPPPPAPELEEVLIKELESHKIEEITPEVIEKEEIKKEDNKIEAQQIEEEIIEVKSKEPEVIEEHRIEINNDDNEEIKEEVYKVYEESEEEEGDHAQHDKLSRSSIIDDDSSGSSSLDEDISSSSDVVPVVFEETNTDETKPKLKGILKAPGQKNKNKRIVFDPFVLFLDGALEGQLDTVKENAAKIDNVSKPNDEGITALHNAICACHYDIVKFLVDVKADVNALDSDGWSPLHCAASCNNLAMLKLLVENGACIYATTLSDAEMPIRKCEEKEAGFDQCVNYLEMCDRWAGVINNGFIYAIYDFEAENDDELSFKEGDALKVISKNGSEDGFWWLCELDNKKGLVPTNFIGLYPTLKIAEQIQFKHFDIPTQSPNVVNKSVAASTMKNNDLDISGTMEISANA